jgi:outer membrane protein
MNRTSGRRMRRAWCAAAMLALGAATAWAGDREQVRLTLAECVGLALENNLDLEIEKVTRRMAWREGQAARGGYDPALSASAERREEDTLGSAGTDGARFANEAASESLRASLAGATGLWGLDYELGVRLGQSSGTREGNPFDSAGGSAGLTLTQPLLRGFRADGVRYRVALADAQSAEAAVRLEGRAEAVLAEVEAAWYGLIQAREAIRAQEEAVRLATQLYEDNQRRVRIGAMSVLDEKQAESQAATARADLSLAKRAYAEAQNRLKTLLFADHRGTRAMELAAAGELTAESVAVDAAASGERALERRTDLREARMALERQGATVAYERDQTLPSLDLVAGAGWAASDEDGHGGAIDRIGSMDEPYWSVGVALDVPLGNRAARSRYGQSRDAARKLRLQLAQLEEAALVEVDDAAIAVVTGLERARATSEARRYAEQALWAEQAKLENGKSTSFVVLQLQRDLTQARTAEIRALADYNRQLSALSLAEGTLLERLGVDWAATDAYESEDTGPAGGMGDGGRWNGGMME